MNRLSPKRRLLYAAFLLFPFASLTAQVPIGPPADELNKPFGESDEEAFASPPKVFYPETWFHYIGGNVSPKGITADLEAIAAAGFSGIQLFHGQFGGVWPGTESQIACLSPLWDDAVRHTAEECKRLGLRFTMQGCPGWAMAGGPWIKPEQAMRHLAWSRTDATSGASNVTLPVPQPSEEEWRDYRDVAVIAFPTPTDDTGKPLEPEDVRSNRAGDWKKFIKGEADAPMQLSPAGENDPNWVEITFPEETVVRTVEFPSVNSLTHAWCYEPGVELTVQAILPSGSAEDILHTYLPQGSWQDDRPVSLACTETEGVRKYRIVIRNEHDMTLQSLRLFSAARKNNWESEAGWTLRSIERNGQSAEQSPDTYVKMSRIIDLSDKLNEDGSLDWKAPEGKWTVLRIGHVNTGMKNGPAPAEGTGWECDKLSTAGSDAQFDGYIGRLAKSGGPLAGGLLNGVLFDSWECKTQTWTPEMEKEFVERTGYGLRKWIPALFGYVIDTPEETARFLNDWRRVVGNLFAENFFGNMARRAREQGLSISYETAAGDIFPADILEYYKYADVPMCEFWQPFSEGYVGSLNFKPIKPTASAARLYGKPRVAAESFTSFAHTWDEHFQMLKEVANVNTTEGVTHLIFHTYTHNPQVGFPPPGTSFSGAGIGTPFLRGQTWWKYMPEFTTYLARCGYLLERGKPVSDILWYLGDEIDHKPDQEIPFPAGFKYDYCNTDILLNRLKVDNGRIVTPEGIGYRVLWLPETTRMLPETAEKLYALINDGATVIGNAPQGPATLIGGKKARKRLDTAAAKIWGNSAPGIRNVGKDRIVAGISLDDALKRLAIEPDVNAPEVLWLHRTTDRADWYYVCAPKGKGFRGTVDFRCSGRVQLWDPVSGTVRDVPAEPKDDRTRVGIDLPAAGSCFVVFRKDGSKAPRIEAPEVVSTQTLTAPWELKFPEGWGAPVSVELVDLKPWKDLDISPEGKAFSGTAEYNSAFEIGPVKKDRHYILDLGDVERIAEVYVNGEFVRTLWTPPYSLDITDRVRDGKNSITVKVTNTWFNRLVYDAARPESDRKTWVLKWPDKNAPLKESGLLGPVSIRTMQ